MEKYGTLEISKEYLVSEGSKLNVFEVKSSGIGKHESINEFAIKYSKHVHKLYLVSQKDACKDGALLMRPFYLFPFLLTT